MKPLLIVVGPALLLIILAFRITALRKDRTESGRYFANPFDGVLLPQELLSPDQYTERGRRLLPWLWVALLLVVVSGIVALGLIA